jgi:hypothetical protein
MDSTWLVDPDQSISVDPVNSRTHFMYYRPRYKSRRVPRGRRHQVPTNPSATRVRREPPTGPS